MYETLAEMSGPTQTLIYSSMLLTLDSSVIVSFNGWYVPLDSANSEQNTGGDITS
jgi:hypothetical protein